MDGYTLDRISEIVVFIGLASLYNNMRGDVGDVVMVYVVMLALGGSLMVSYTRARAEGLGFDCKVGFMQRAERIILLALGTIIGVIFKIFDPVMIGVLCLIALISNFTALQRIFFVKKAEKEKS